MFYTNVGTPNKLTLGDTYHDACIRLVGWITGASGSPWAEVTASAPTPLFLRGYASTAVGGTSSATSNGYAHHTTMYMTTDAGLAAGTPHCVLVRFFVGYHGVAMGIMDTKFADPDVDEDWCILYASSNITGDTSNEYGYDEAYGKILTWSTSSAVTTVSDVNRIEVNLWIWDECFVIACKDNDNTTYDLMGGGCIVWHPAENGVIGADRGDFPHIWAMDSDYDGTGNNPFGASNEVVFVPRNNITGTDATLSSASVSGQSQEAMAMVGELGRHVETEAQDINGNETIQRAMFIGIRENSNTSNMSRFAGGSFFSGPWDEGPRLLRRGLISTNGYLDTAFTIDSVNYTLVKDVVANSLDACWDCLIILPHSDLTV